jgi:hypothetical protein
MAIEPTRQSGCKTLLQIQAVVVDRPLERRCLHLQPAVSHKSKGTRLLLAAAAAAEISNTYLYGCSSMYPILQFRRDQRAD